MEIKSLIDAVLPILLPLFFGASFLSFLVERLKRRDAVADRTVHVKQELGERARFYERAFAKSDGYGRSLFQVISSASTAYKADNQPMLKALLEIASDLVGEQRDGKWQQKEYPNHLEQTREELRLEDSPEHNSSST